MGQERDHGRDRYLVTGLQTLPTANSHGLPREKHLWKEGYKEKSTLAFRVLKDKKEPAIATGKETSE